MAGLPVEGFPSPTEKTVQGERLPVPSVIGRSVADATGILEAAGFSVRVGDAIYSSRPRGVVAAQSPGAGALLTPGSVVILNPSAGPAPAPRPEPQPEPAPTEGPPDNPGRGNEG